MVCKLTNAAPATRVSASFGTLTDPCGLHVREGNWHSGDLLLKRSLNSQRLRVPACLDAPLQGGQEISASLFLRRKIHDFASELRKKWIRLLNQHLLNSRKNTSCTRQRHGEFWINDDQLGGVMSSNRGCIDKNFAPFERHSDVLAIIEIGQKFQCVTDTCHAVCEFNLKTGRTHNGESALASPSIPTLRSCKPNRHSQCCECSERCEPCRPIANCGIFRCQVIEHCISAHKKRYGHHQHEGCDQSIRQALPIFVSHLYPTLIDGFARKRILS